MERAVVAIVARRGFCSAAAPRAAAHAALQRDHGRALAKRTPPIEWSESNPYSAFADTAPEKAVGMWAEVMAVVSHHKQLLEEGGIHSDVSMRDRVMVNARRVGLKVKGPGYDQADEEGEEATGRGSFTATEKPKPKRNASHAPPSTAEAVSAQLKTSKFAKALGYVKEDGSVDQDLAEVRAPARGLALARLAVLAALRMIVKPFQPRRGPQYPFSRKGLPLEETPRISILSI